MSERNVEKTLNTSETPESRGAENSPDTRQLALENANKALARANVESARLITRLQDKVELLSNELLRYHLAVAKIEPELRRASQALCGMKDTYCNQVASECDKYHQVLRSLEQPLMLSTGILTNFCSPSQASADQASSCNIREVLSEVLNDYASQAATRQIEMTLSVSPELPDTMYLPAQALQQFTRELINNAIKHGQPSTIAITLDMKETGPQGSVLQLSVTDDGVGMSAETLGKIKAAIESHSMSALDDRAIGQGYTLLPRLAELCEGRLSVKSMQESGTAVSIEVPMHHQHAVEDATRRHFQSLSDTLREAGTPLPVGVVAESMEQLANDCQTIAELATQGQATMLTNWSQLREYLLNPRNAQACLLLHGDYGLECMRRLSEELGESKERQCFLFLSTASNAATTNELRDLGINGMLRIPITATRVKEVLQGVKGRLASRHT